MPNLNPGPSSSAVANTKTQVTAGVYTYAQLPPASQYPAGTVVWTTDRGQYVSNGSAWSPTGSLLGTYTFATLPSAATVSSGASVWTTDQGLVISNGAFWTKVSELSPSGYRVALFGDSLNDGYTNGLTISSITVFNKVATVTCGYFPQAYPGDYITMRNLGDTTASDEWSGKLIQILDNPTDYSFTFATNKADGTYTTLNGQTWRYSTKSACSVVSTYQMLNYLLGSPMTLIGNFAVASSYSTATAAIVSKVLANNVKFDIAFIQTGTNDLASGIVTSDATAKTAANTLVTNITNMCNQLLSYGVTPIIGILGFYNSPNNTTAFPNLAATYARRGIKAYVAANPKCIVIDHQENFGDGTAANGASIANTMNTDGYHPIIGANLLSARQTINSGVLNGSLKTLPQLASPIWIKDDGFNNSYTGNVNIVPNPGFTGTGGPNYGNAITGTIPDNWQFTGNTFPATTGVTSTPNATRVVPTGGNPNLTNLVKAWTLNIAAATASGQQIDIWSAYSTTGFATKMVAGQWYRAGITVNATNNWSGIAKFKVFLQQNGTLPGRSLGSILAQNATEVMYSTDVWSLLNGDVMTITTEPFFVPVGSTWSGAYMYIQIGATSSGSVSANFQLSNPFCITVPNPYA